jgi:citrate lyase subunit beta/citryl-CoA lyase
MISNAISSAADVVIFDLEDAVAPAAKEAARNTLCTWLTHSEPPRKEIVVRVNGLGTPWCRADLQAVCQFDIAAVLFPKIDTAIDLQAATSLLESHSAGPGPGLWCMIETPLAILNAQSIAAAVKQPSARMQVWVMGTNDLAKLLGIRLSASPNSLAPYLAAALLAARAYGLKIFDGVHNDIRDSHGFRRACEAGAAMGFDGKTLIHPSQIEVCNEVYSPSEAEISHARAVVAAFRRSENKDAGVLQIDGKMVELLHEQVAQRTIEIAEAIAAIDRDEA